MSEIPLYVLPKIQEVGAREIARREIPAKQVRRSHMVLCRVTSLIRNLPLLGVP